MNFWNYRQRGGATPLPYRYFNPISQVGAGNCSLCGSPGTTKATCPLNPNAANPNPAKHPLAVSALSPPVKVTGKRTAPPPTPKPPAPIPKPPAPVPTPAPKKTQAVKKTIQSRWCNPQTDKKYVTRPSPPYPANECCGMVLEGNDGLTYESRADKRGVCRWYKVKL